MDKETRYQEFKDKLLSIFKDATDEQMHLASGLIERLAFMQITIEDLESDIRDHGLFELTKTRPRKLRERPVVRTYNTMLKNYNTTIKQLIDRLPSGSNGEAEDELLAFLRDGM